MKNTGSWMDDFGSCRICDGEIPNGHSDNCDFYKLEQERDQLKQEVTRLTTACENEFASVQQLSDENQKLKQQLLASELNRERMRSVLQEQHNHHQQELNVYFEQDGKPLESTTDLGDAYSDSALAEKTTFALSEPQPLAFTEALKPVREALELYVKNIYDGDKAKQALAELDKLCGSAPQSDNLRTSNPSSPNTRTD